MTIREHIQEIKNEVVKGDLLPDRAAELLNTLSALLGNIVEEILARDMAYNKILLYHLENEEKANRAKIKAEISPEFEAMRIARNTKEVAIEMIRSLKFYLKQKEEEMRQSRNL